MVAAGWYVLADMESIWMSSRQPTGERSANWPQPELENQALEP
jgi:hypothetical protein